MRVSKLWQNFYIFELTIPLNFSFRVMKKIDSRISVCTENKEKKKKKQKKIVEKFCDFFFLLETSS